MEVRQLDVDEGFRKAVEKRRKTKEEKKEALRVLEEKRKAQKEADDQFKKTKAKKKEKDKKKAREKSLGTLESRGQKRKRSSNELLVPSPKRKNETGHSYSTRSKTSTTQGSSSRAFQSRSKSSSLTSRFMNPFQLQHYNIDLSLEYLRKRPFRYYSLTDMAEHYRVNIHDFQETKKNEKIACRILSEMVESNWKVEYTATIDGFKSLSPMIASTNFIPDVVIKCEDIPGFLGEVHSSPYQNSINKAILGVTDLFRLHRAQEIDIEELRGFFFPKCEEKTCLVEIKVTFEHLQFKVELFAYSKMTEGLSRLCQVVHSQCSILFYKYQSKSYKHIFSSHILFRLTTKECEFICGPDGKQMKSSSHIILQADDGMIYKLLYNSDEERALRDIKDVLAIKKCSRVIFPELVERSPLLYKYPKVKFSPLTTSKAKECLKSFVKEVKLALDELHQIGFSHNDLRLPNICFNEKYEAVLIDLDRVHPIHQCYSMFFEENPSCMYDLCNFKGDHTGYFTDFLQLGWLIAWIIYPVGNEHKRKWEYQPDVIRNNEFIKELVEEGTFNNAFLRKFPEGKHLKTVLEESI